MATIESRLNELERKATETDTGYVIHIHRAGREVETPIAYTNHATGEIYSVDDARFEALERTTGLHVFFAEYGDWLNALPCLKANYSQS